MKSKTILNIKILKTKIKLYFSDSTTSLLHPNVLSNLNLYKGKEISEKDLKLIKEQTKEETYFDFIKKKLALGQLSSGKVIDLLTSKEASKKQIQSILKRLNKYNLIDDETIVNDCIEWADYKHVGYKKLINKLYSHKVNEEIIKSIKYDDEHEKEKAKLYYDSIKGKFSNRNNIQRKQCIYNSLIRNGFESSIAEELIQKNVIYDNKHELNVLKLDYLKLISLYSKRYSGNELRNKITNSLLTKGYKLSDIEQMEAENEVD